MSASLGSAVEGEMIALVTYYTECGHEYPADKSRVSGVYARRDIAFDVVDEDQLRLLGVTVIC